MDGELGLPPADFDDTPNKKTTETPELSGNSYQFGKTGSRPGYTRLLMSQNRQDSRR